jgi:hypothetical protein
LRTTTRLSLLFCAALTVPWQAFCQTCPVTITGAEPRAPLSSLPAGSVPPFLRVTYRNNSPFTIVRLVFQVHFPGALGEFQSISNLPPGANGKSTWSDAAFIQPVGEAVNVDVELARVEFATKNSWIDDGSHLCAHIFKVEDAEDAGQDSVQDSSTLPRRASLLVPPTTKGLGGIPAFAHARPATFIVARIIPIATDNDTWGALLALKPTTGAPLVEPKFEPMCPVEAGYLDLGGDGRLYTSLRSRTNKAVKSAEFTIRTGTIKQTIRSSIALAAGKGIATTWQTSPALMWSEPTSLHLDRVVYSDSSVWADDGRATCETTARPDLNSTSATKPQEQQKDLPIIVTGTGPVVPSPTPVPDTAATVKVAPKAQIPVAPSSKPVAADTTGPVAAAQPPHHDPVFKEDASPESFRENAPLIKEGKASLCTITTTPPGADVTLDGKHLGNTPLVFVLLREGNPRVIDLTLGGYKVVHSTQIPNGQTIPLDVKFEPAQP